MWPLFYCCDVSSVAMLSAVGGLSVHAQTGSVQAAYMGFSASAVLGMSAVAMSDIRDSELGELGVKAAWGECLYSDVCGAGGVFGGGGVDQGASCRGGGRGLGTLPACCSQQLQVCIAHIMASCEAP